MHQKFTNTERRGGALHVWGGTDALEISSPHEGVMRLRASPAGRHMNLGFPRLPDKRSFAVVGGDAQDLTHESDGDTVRVRAGNLTAEVDLRRGVWRVTNAQGAVLADALEVRGDPDGGLHRASLTLDAPRGAAYLGFGEKVGPLDKRGLRFTFWNTDHFPHHTDSDPLYGSIPFCTVLQDGHASGLFLDETWRSEVDIAHREPDELTWVSAGPELDLYVIDGPSVADVLRRYTDLTGRFPMPPLWALGYAQSRWGYRDEDDVMNVVEGYRSRDLPLDAVYVDIDYMDGYKVFTWDAARFPDPQGTIQAALDRGVRLVPIVDPGVKLEAGYRVYEEALARDFLVRTNRGEVLVGEVWPNPAVYPDFTQDDVVEWWAGHFRAALADQGIAGVWNDMNEPSCFSLQGAGGTEFQNIEGPGGTVEGKTLPYDARHGKKLHIEVHNVYAMGMNAAARRGFELANPDRRPFLVSRAGYAGIQRYAAMWSGDNTSVWSHLALSLPMLTGMGLSGVSFCGADVGGFLRDTTGELLARWTQMGAFYPLMRNHAAAGTRPQEPWRFEERVVDAVREALHVRYRVLPTLYTLVRESGENGLPPLRPMIMHDQTDMDALRDDTQVMLGADLLVAPVLTNGAEKRLVYLPAGRWVELFNLDRAGAVHEGRQHVVASAPLDVLPVYLRAGGAVALAAPAQHTTSANWPELTWHVHAAEQVSGRLYEDDGDGYGPSRDSRLGGGLDGRTLRLTLTEHGDLGRARERETVCVYGLGDVQDVQGAERWEVTGGVLRLTVQAGWREVTVTVS